MLEMNRLGGGLVALLAGVGGGDGAGLLLRKDSGVVARSSSVLSRSGIGETKKLRYSSLYFNNFFYKIFIYFSEYYKK